MELLLQFNIKCQTGGEKRYTQLCVLIVGRGLVWVAREVVFQVIELMFMFTRLHMN